MGKLPEKWCIFPKNEEEFEVILSWARIKSGKKYSDWLWHSEVSFDYTGEYRGYQDNKITFEDFKKLVLKEDNMKELKITEEKVKETIKNHPEARGVLESLFPEVKEKTFRCGDIVKRSVIYGDECIIAQVARNMVCLISMSSGNRYREAIGVKYTDKISLSEMRLMGYTG